jgi:2',3'-cyclic-nucleotide 2'-phosphodiesterase (5'-nucleotidase family)
MRVWLYFMAALALAGCRSTETIPLTGEPTEAVSFTVVSDDLAPDEELGALIAPFRDRMIDETATVIGSTPTELRTGRPEGTLGNMAADAMLSVVQDLTDRPVDMALTNNGGLRTPVGPGEITVGKMFELMPFDNVLVIFDLSAAQVDSLSQQLARNGGDPIAGFSFAISGHRAVDVRVGGETLEEHRTYRLVTSDYLANGAGPYEVLWSIEAREDLDFLLRDVFIEWVHATGTVTPVLDGRIRTPD